MCPCTKAPDNYDDENDNNDDGDDANNKAGNKAENRAGDDDGDGDDNDITIMLSPCTTELSRKEHNNYMEDQTTEIFTKQDENNLWTCPSS